MSNRNASSTQPVIVVKKIAASAHHGGAWKVAYADFVTAMMALFIVLWLMNASPEIQKAVSLYFTDPKGFQNLDGTGNVGVEDVSNAMLLNKDDMPALKEKISDTLKSMPNLGSLKDQVEMTVTGEGLRIELVDKEGNSFFQSGAKEMTPSAKAIVSALALEIGKLENPIVLEGHTDAKPYSASGYYSNWDLSTDRANAALRFMQQHGVRQGQVTQLRGFADRQLRNPKDPFDYANRRVSIIVGFDNMKQFPTTDSKEIPHPLDTSHPAQLEQPHDEPSAPK
ncbi:MAG: OmpA family protein [Bryobacterales bacterium]|nr:OmpA family protein [Bryobacterales bacterium]